MDSFFGPVGSRGRLKTPITSLGPPNADRLPRQGIRFAREKGAGIRRIARDLGVGVGTVMRMIGAAAAN